jgi:hypothetical protein
MYGLASQSACEGREMNQMCGKGILFDWYSEISRKCSRIKGFLYVFKKERGKNKTNV